MNDAVFPTAATWLKGWVVIDGEVTTVSVTTFEIVVPLAFDTLQRNWSPLRAAVASRVGVLLLAEAAVLLRHSSVPLRYCHW